jgi:hypothetical protein
MSLVEVDTPLRNVLAIGSCEKILDLCLIQILLYLVLHLCIHLDILARHCTEVPDYTARGYTVATHYDTVTALCCTATTHCCMVVVPS